MSFCMAGAAFAEAQSCVECYFACQAQSRVHSVKCRVWSVTCRVWSVKCRVWSVKCKV